MSILPKMASAKPEQKKCGVCSQPITAGYLTFGDYCGTTVCMRCLSKNTWSMCRKCNGTLIDYPQSPATTITSIPEDLTSSGVKELFESTIIKLRAELARVTAINKLAEKIRYSSAAKIRELEEAVREMETQSQKELIAKTRKEARDEGPAGYVSLSPIDGLEDSIQQHLEPFRKSINLEYTNKVKHELNLLPNRQQLRVKVFYGRPVVYKLDAEYAEIIARSGEACDIAFMQSHSCGPICVAIKTKDNLVHILYCRDIEYPYKSSRYIDYNKSTLPLSSLKLELSDSFRSVMKDWDF